MSSSKLVFKVSRNRFPNDPEGSFPIGGQKEVWSLSDGGEQVVAGNIEPNVLIANTTEPGFLKISYRGQPVMDFLPEGGKVKLRLRYKNLGNTTLPGTGPNWLTIRNAHGKNVLQLYESGYLYHSGALRETSTMGTRGFQIQSVKASNIDQPQLHKDANLNINGEMRFRKIVMAPENLKFHSDKDFTEYENPGIITDWVNIGKFLPAREAYTKVFEKMAYNKGVDDSDFTEPQHVPLGTRADRLPLMGNFYFPDGKGPFPLVGILHGGAFSNVDSAKGFDYLASTFASWGYACLVVSYDYLVRGQGELSIYEIQYKTTLPDEDYENMPQRAILFLELLKSLQQTASKSSLLRGKIAFDKVMLAGYSLGGQAVNISTFFSTLSGVYLNPDASAIPLDGSAPLNLGPYHFKIKSQVELAAQNDYIPYDQKNHAQRKRPSNGTDLLTLIGSRDHEVEHFLSYRNFVALNPSRFKAMVWLLKGNHGGFSTGANQKGSAGPGSLDTTFQRTITQLCSLVMADVTISGNDTYLDTFRKNPTTALAERWFYDPVKFITQYREPHEQLLVEVNESTNEIKPANGFKGFVTKDFDSNLGMNYARPIRFIRNSNSKSSFFEFFGDFDVPAIEIAWTVPQAQLKVNFSTPVSVNNWKYFFLHAGQAPVTKHMGHSLNTKGLDQDFTVVLQGNTDSVSFAISEFYNILWPDTDLGSATDLAYEIIVLQTIRVSMVQLRNKGWRSTQLQGIHFVFNKRNRGLIYLSDVGFGQA